MFNGLPLNDLRFKQKMTHYLSDKNKNKFIALNFTQITRY